MRRVALAYGWERVAEHLLCGATVERGMWADVLDGAIVLRNELDAARMAAFFGEVRSGRNGRRGYPLLKMRMDGELAVEGGLVGVGRAATGTGRHVEQAGRRAVRGARSFVALRASSRGLSGSFGVIARGATSAAAALGGIYAVGGGLKFAFDEASDAAARSAPRPLR